VKLYFKIIFSIIFLIFWLGLIGPFCISNNTEFIIGYGLISIFLVPISISFYKKEFTMLKKFLNLSLLLSVVFLVGCSTVPAGNVGIKFYLLGTNKGVDYEELTPGRYWIGINEQLFIFPTFTQNYVWTSDKQESSPNDESFNFQDRQGLELNADIGITYHINPEDVDLIFQKYKRGIDEITDVFLRNMVRDALVSRASVLPVEYIYGEGRSSLMDSVTKDVSIQCSELGIIIDKIYWIGRIKLPASVKAAVDQKMIATQKAQQREFELRQTEAEAKKKIAESEGEAESILKVAIAQAKANDLINKSLTKKLIQYKTIECWNGSLPQITGNAIPFVDVTNLK
jgi:regulator of protease activity HflC (stomatin/prohibitin superfamily)